MAAREDVLLAAEDVAASLRATYRVRGKDLKAVATAAGRKLPPRVRRQTQRLADSAHRLRHQPRSAPSQPVKVLADAKAVIEFLEAETPQDDRRAARRRWAGDLAVNLLLFALVFGGVVFLATRG